MSVGDQFADAALRWVGTPYRHQASCRGAGTDCLGLLRGVWRELYGAEPEAAPAYSADWSEPQGQEALWAAAERHLIAKGLGEAARGGCSAISHAEPKCRQTSRYSGADRRGCGVCPRL